MEAGMVKTCAIVLGITGAGKSNFLNNFACGPKKIEKDGKICYKINTPTSKEPIEVPTISVPQLFQTFDIDEYTKEGKIETITIDGKQLDIIDIPGINGIFEDEWIIEHYTTMVKKYSHISKVFLVQSLYRPEINATLRFLFQIFGPTVLPHVHFVFTHVDKYVSKKFDENDISKNHGIVQRGVWNAYNKFFEVCKESGLAFQIRSYSCVAKNFSKVSSFSCDMFAEIDYVRSLVKESLDLKADRYNVNNMCHSTHHSPSYLSECVFDSLIEKFNRLEFEQRNIAEQVKNTELSWWISRPYEFFRDYMYQPAGRVVTFETYNSVFQLYFDLLFCVKSWEFISKANNKINSFCNPDGQKLETMQNILEKAAKIIEKIVTSCKLFVTRLPSGLFVCDYVRRCEYCGAAWGNLGGCNNRICGANFDNFDIKQFGKRQNGKIDVVSVACGQQYDWNRARPLFLHEVVGLMDMNDLKMIFDPPDKKIPPSWFLFSIQK